MLIVWHFIFRIRVRIDHDVMSGDVSGDCVGGTFWEVGDTVLECLKRGYVSVTSKLSENDLKYIPLRMVKGF